MRNAQRARVLPRAVSTGPPDRKTAPIDLDEIQKSLSVLAIAITQDPRTTVVVSSEDDTGILRINMYADRHTTALHQLSGRDNSVYRAFSSLLDAAMRGSSWSPVLKILNLRGSLEKRPVYESSVRIA